MNNFFRQWVLCLKAMLIICYCPIAISITDAELELKITNIQKLGSLESQNSALLKLTETSSLSEHQTASVLLIIGKNHANLDQLNLATSPLLQALKLKPNEQLRANINRLLGIIYYYLEKPTKSLKHYKSALSYYIKTEQHIMSANTENNIALAYESKNDYLEALKYYESAEPRFIQYGTEQDRLDVKLNIAGLFAKLDFYSRANTQYKHLIENHFEVLDITTQALLLSNAAVPLNSAGQHEQAITYLEKSISLYQKLEDDYSLASAYMNLADSYILLKNYDKAAEALSKSESFAQGLDNSRLEFYIPFYRSRIAMALNDTETALNKINLAIDIANKKEDTGTLRKAYYQAMIIYGANQLVEQANEIKNKQINLINKANEKVMHEKLAQIQVDYEQEKLISRVDELENEKRLQQLAMSKSKQQRIFIIGAIFLVLLLLFALQRRKHESKAKQEALELVEKRTKELKKSSEDLRQASLVKSKFLANMSHEIRTPLTAIIGQSEAMSHLHYNKYNFNKDLQVINNNGRHLLDLINDILDISRIEENKLDLDIKSLNLKTLVDEISDMFTTLSESKGIYFNVQYCLEDDFAIKADAFRLKQILLNLCSNAVKFTDEGSVTLLVKETFNGVQFNVIDTGIGMEEKQLEEVFDSFSQGDSSISRRFGGSGLGLCLSEQLANLMKGSISVTSEINKGSEFILHLNVPKLKLAQQPPLRKITATPTLEGRVLLAEDHADNRELISIFLKQLGLSVVAVENGLEAVQQCNDSQFDLVLLDIQMPVLNGLSALKQLKENGFTNPIIAITANTMQHEILSYLEQGFSDHIKKPLEQKAFVATLSKYLNQLNHSSDVSDFKIGKIIENTDLVERFVANLDKEKTHLSDLYQTQNWIELQNQLHKLRGAAAIFEFHSIASAADYFEKAIKFNDDQVYQEAYEGMNSALSEYLDTI